MAVTRTEQSTTHILENLVLGVGQSAMLISGAQVPVRGMYLISFTADLASAAANTAVLQEFTLTDSADDVIVEVGDLFIPFGHATINAGLTFAPAVAETEHKVPLMTVNSTVGALDAASATISALWIKTVTSTA